MVLPYIICNLHANRELGLKHLAPCLWIGQFNTELFFLLQTPACAFLWASVHEHMESELLDLGNTSGDTTISSNYSS